MNYFSSQSQNPILTDLLLPGINFMSGIVGIVVIASIVIAGIQYITSSGNPEAAASARRRIQASVISLVVYIFGFALLQWLVPGGLFNSSQEDNSNQNTSQGPQPQAD